MIINSPETFLAATQDIGFVIAFYSLIIVGLLLVAPKLLELVKEKFIMLFCSVALQLLLIFIVWDDSATRVFCYSVGICMSTLLVQVSALSLIQKAVADPFHGFSHAFLCRIFCATSA